MVVCLVVAPIKLTNQALDSTETLRSSSFSRLHPTRERNHPRSPDESYFEVAGAALSGPVEMKAEGESGPAKYRLPGTNLTTTRHLPTGRLDLATAAHTPGTSVAATEVAGTS